MWHSKPKKIITKFIGFAWSKCYRVEQLTEIQWKINLVKPCDDEGFLQISLHRLVNLWQNVRMLSVLFILHVFNIIAVGRNKKTFLIGG